MPRCRRGECDRGRGKGPRVSALAVVQDSCGLGTHHSVVVLDELERAHDVEDGHDPRRLFWCARLRRREEVVEARAGRLGLDDAAVVELPVEVRLVRDRVALARLLLLGGVAVARGWLRGQLGGDSSVRRERGTHASPTYPTASTPKTGPFHRHAAVAKRALLLPATRRANDGLPSVSGLGASG